ADATQTQQVRDFFIRHYGAVTNNDAAITSHRFVPLPTWWKVAVRQAFVVLTSNLSIGNPDVCNGIGRPL
ncbi:TPA: protein disulfide reductase, partial [Pseudomonas aeruginosa]|nr:protein disulfide reductase [Pseudomonas aeruginosa]